MKHNTLVLSLAVMGLSAPVHAYDVTENFSVGGVLSGAGQCQYLQDDAGNDDQCKGGIPI